MGFIELWRQVRERGDMFSLILVLFILTGTIVSASSEVLSVDNKPQSIDVHRTKLTPQTYSLLKNVSPESVLDVIVAYKDSKNKPAIPGIEIKKDYSGSSYITLKANPNVISLILESQAVKYLEIDQATKFTSDGITWNIKRTKADTVWDKVTGSGVKIAILDSGIANHDDLTISGGVSFVDDSHIDAFGHGTQVAGIIAALSNNAGLKGVSPNISLYSVKITDSAIGSMSDAVAGLQWAIDNEINMVVMSFGFEDYSQIFKEKVQEAYTKGVLLVGAAGNNGGTTVLYPAGYSDVIAVGATEMDDNLASFSNTGYQIELVAPGTNINTTSIDNNYALVSGTSFAVPHVAGVAALIKELNFSLNNSQIRGKLRNDAFDLGEAGRDPFFGFGLVQTDIISTNYTLRSDAYFYEIYSIEFAGNNYTIISLYAKGHGTIDDVDFGEGDYLIKLFYDENSELNIVHVNERGEFELEGITIDFSDTFSEDGSSAEDGKGWKNDSSLTIIPRTSSWEDDAYCLDVNNDGTWDHCRYNNSNDLQDCKDYSDTLTGNGRAFYDTCTANSSKCIQDIGFDDTFLQSDSSIKEQQVELRWYLGCDNTAGSPSRSNSQDSNTYYVFDRRKAVCTSSTIYKTQGRYFYDGENPDGWQNYRSSISCSASKECDFAIDENATADKTVGISPCRLKVGEVCAVTNECLTGLACVNSTCTNISGPATCNGLIEINSLYHDGSPENGSYVYLNSVSNGTTNVNGQKFYTLNNVGCGMDQPVSVYCSNNQSKLCGSSSTQIDFDNDTDSLFFYCSLCKTDANLAIETDGVVMGLNQDGTYNITAIIHTQNINVPSGVNITFKGQNKDTGLISVEASALTQSITSARDYNATVSMNLAGISYLHITVDPAESIDEPKTDNYVLIPVVKRKLKAYVSVDTGYSMVDTAIREYLRFFIDDVPQAAADVILAIGKDTYEAETYSPLTLDAPVVSFGVEEGQIKAMGKFLDKPYNGLVGTYKNSTSGDVVIFVYGNRVEGTIAALKEFMAAREVFLSEVPFLNADNVNRFQ
ncbi:S8 family peptidase, partial [Candidatus Woesearchaeota archaeon]|nr:S8 family peptidase [Candidatus Woesearchaeota archaeon]